MEPTNFVEVAWKNLTIEQPGVTIEFEVDDEDDVKSATFDSEFGQLKVEISSDGKSLLFFIPEDEKPACDLDALYPDGVPVATPLAEELGIPEQPPLDSVAEGCEPNPEGCDETNPETGFPFSGEPKQDLEAQLAKDLFNSTSAGAMGADPATNPNSEENQGGNPA